MISTPTFCVYVIFLLIKIMDRVCSQSSDNGTSTVTLDPSSYLTTPIITSYSAYTTQAISSRDSLILSTYSGLLSSTIPPLTLNTLTVNGGIFETTSLTTSNITDIAIQSSAVGTSFWLQPSKDIVSSNVDYSRTESVPSMIVSVNTKPGGITSLIDKESTRSSDFLNSDIISYFQPFSMTDTLGILSSNSYTVTPERTSIFVTSDIYLFTESYSYNSNILSMNTLTSSNLSDGSKSEPVATSLSSISHYLSSTSLDYTSLTSLMSSASETLSSSSDVLTHSIPTSSSLSLSSLSTTYNLPGILPTLTTGSSTLKTVHYSSEPRLSTISTDILHETSQNVVSSTVSSTWTLAQTSPVSEGVTSAFDKMSTSIFTTTDPRFGDLEKQVADLKEVQNKYMIAVIVLALIIVALIALIVLYVIRRRRYYEKKRLNPGGIDSDLLNGSETNKRPKKKTYFNAEHAESLRISGRISTASLGDNEPLNALKSFNKSKDQTEDTEEKRDKKLENISDESL